MFGIEGMEPVQIKVTAIPQDKGHVFGLLLDANGKPAKKADAATVLAHAQVVTVTRGKAPGVWLRVAGMPQVEVASVKGAVWIVPFADVRANEPALRGNGVRAVRCQHRHDATITGYAGTAVWTELRGDGAGYCEYWCDRTAACLGRTRVGKAKTFDVAHTTDVDTCGEANRLWKRSPARRAADAVAAAAAAEVARVKEEKRVAAAAKARATRAARRAAKAVEAA